MTVCKHCDREGCRPVFYHLCPGCEGEGCPDCAKNLIPGIVPGQVETAENIGICTEWNDPEMDAAMDGQHESLIEAVTYCRDEIMREREAANETF